MGDLQIKKQPKKYDAVIVGSGAGGGPGARGEERAREREIHPAQRFVCSLSRDQGRAGRPY